MVALRTHRHVGRESSHKLRNARTKLSDIVRPLDRLTDAAVGAHDPPPTSPPLTGATPGPPLLARLLGERRRWYSVWRRSSCCSISCWPEASGAPRASSCPIRNRSSRAPGAVGGHQLLRRNRRRNRHVGNRTGPWCGVLTFALEFIPYSAPREMGDSSQSPALRRFPTSPRAAAPICYLAIRWRRTTWCRLRLCRPVEAQPARGHGLRVVGWFIWGIAGVFLAIPIAATLKALGDQVPRLAPLGELLGA